MHASTPEWLTLSAQPQVRRCLVCGSSDLSLLFESDVATHVHNWREWLAIDISGELQGWNTIPLYECAQCGLQSFPPELAGSAAMYAQLGEYPWYYVPHKWEHSAAKRNMKATDRVLEVGCGSGSFIQWLQEHGIEAWGIEMNEQAVRDAQARGLPVTLSTLEEFASSQPASFDVVCGFQVLEHVPHPAQFIEACITLLKPRGRLIFGVPDNDGLLKHDPRHLLNLPPHHITRWSRRSFESLSSFFPLRVVRVRREPLAEYHIQSFADIHMQRLPNIRYLSRLVREVVQRIVVPAIRLTRFNRILRGHTIYVCYELVDRP